jgi:hypothetical protein
MKYPLHYLGLAVLLAACANEPKQDNQQNVKTQETKTDQGEWISLFDGKTTQGWHTYGKDSIGRAWKVKDGSLYLDTSNKADWQVADGGDIVSEQEFEDFHLQLEWKISENGNSGIMFYVQEEPLANRAGNADTPQRRPSRR